MAKSSKLFSKDESDSDESVLKDAENHQEDSDGSNPWKRSSEKVSQPLELSAARERIADLEKEIEVLKGKPLASTRVPSEVQLSLAQSAAFAFDYDDASKALGVWARIQSVVLFATGSTSEAMDLQQLTGGSE